MTAPWPRSCPTFPELNSVFNVHAMVGILKHQCPAVNQEENVEGVPSEHAGPREGLVGAAQRLPGGEAQLRGPAEDGRPRGPCNWMEGQAGIAGMTRSRWDGETRAATRASCIRDIWA